MRCARFAVSAIAISTAAGAAQPTAPVTAPPARPDGAKSPVDPTIAAALTLRARVEAVRTRRGVLPMVAIVTDARGYVGAIGAWGVQSYFPVLFDDGTPASRENIARFVRAFKPERVVRFDGSKGIFWPEKTADQEGYLPHLVAKTLGFPDEAWMKKHAKSGEFLPNGIVLTTVTDPAWPAALALCAGRGQILAFVPANHAPGLDKATNVEWADKLNQVIIDTAGAWGVSYAGLGDTIDAVTMCAGVPNRVQIDKPADSPGSPPFVAKQGEFLATTDFVGRVPSTRARYAWVGQISGTNAESSYRAMCGLFLQPDSAWIFDSYDSGEPWSYFSGRKAAEFFEKANWRVWCNDPAKRGERDFRLAAGAYVAPDAAKKTDGSAGLNASLVLVNSMGNADFFQLKPGSGMPGDVPLLNTPAIVSMVHSWSAQIPGTRTTVGGRFIDHGAYAYIGSVHEPFLTAFVPTPQFAARMFAMPLGAAARHDSGAQTAPWRITVLADPLITLGPPAPRLSLPDRVENTSSLEDELKAQLKDKKFEAALGTLVLLGRDRDANRLCVALLDQDPQNLPPAGALIGVLPAFRCGDLETCARLAVRAGPLVDGYPLIKDALWHAVDGQGRTPTRNEALALKLAIRSDSFARDAKEAAMHLNIAAGPGTGRGLLSSLREKATPEQRQQLDAISKTVP